MVDMDEREKAYIERVSRSMSVISRKSSIPEYGETFDDIEQAYDVALEVMSKEIPKEVKIEPWSPSICPRCGRILSENCNDGYYEHPKFLERCPDIICNQRLKW